jgi:hypothetical protein
MAGNLTIIEPNLRLAHGQEIIRASSSRPPMPAPAVSFATVEKQASPPTQRDIEGSNPSGGSLPPFARNSDTSREAAIAKYDAGTAPSQREMIYRLIMFAGDKGQTREEIAEKLELSGDTVRPRVKELLGEAKNWTDPLVRRNGETRKTKSGLSAEVMVTI